MEAIGLCCLSTLTYPLLNHVKSVINGDDKSKLISVVKIRNDMSGEFNMQD